MSISAQSFAFRSLYEEHYAFVWAVLRKMGVPDRDVEDLLQDTFVIVHRRLDDFEGRASVTTWLYAIVVRVYWNYARRQKNRPSLASISGASLAIVDPNPDPERFTEQQRAGALLESLLGELDVDKRTAFVLAELEGLSAPEIARMTGTKTRTIYSRLRAAKEQVEASARRVAARERNDIVVRQLATRSTRRPPEGLQRRAWIGLAARLSPAPTPVGPWFSLKAIGLSLGIGTGVLGVVSVTAAAVRPDQREPVADGRHVAPSRPGPARAQKPGERAPIPPAPSALPKPATATPDTRAATAAVPDRTSVRTRGGATPSLPTRQQSGDVALLRDARAALKTGDHAAALELLEQHTRSFPKSQLAPERERSKLVALCHLSKHAAAQTLAQRLDVDLPASCGG